MPNASLVGNFGLLAQYGIEWAKIKPLSRVQEAHHVMRTFLDEGAIDFEGEFYRYSGLFTFARPVQEHLPLLIGAMRGPKSFQVAGEISDGIHTALNYSREAFEYVVENVKIGAERGGRDWRSLDIGAWCVCVVAPDSQAAKETAGAIVALYISSMPAVKQVERHGIDPDSLAPIVDALGQGDVAAALELYDTRACRPALDCRHARRRWSRRSGATSSRQGSTTWCSRSQIHTSSRCSQAGMSMRPTSARNFVSFTTRSCRTSSSDALERRSVRQPDEA